MPTFTQALTVEPGERTTADQMASLAAAVNSRLPFDCWWRILFYFHGLFRQVRNPNEGFTAYPPDSEWWNIYAHVEPDDYEWPATGPGDPEGGNLSNISMAWVYGNDSIEIGSELQRLSSVPVGFSGVPVLQPRHIWALGQLQRGAIDLSTGATNSVAWDVARAYAYVRQAATSPHGQSYMGFNPTPVYAGGCVDAADRNPQLIFTSLVDGSTLTYSNNCPEDPASVTVFYTPWAYLIVGASGSIRELKKTEWVEGPYESEAYLTKKEANLLMRGLAHYASEFRGTEAQGAGTTNAHAFDLQKFLTTQYPLAPAFGRQIGDFVQPLYPQWQINGPSASAGASMGGPVRWEDGTVCTGFLFLGSGLTRPCTIRIEENGETLHEVTLPVGDSDQIWWLPDARRLESARAVLVTDLETDSDGLVFVEATMLVDYKPQLHDWYFVTRLSSYNGQLDRLDGRGIDFDKAKEIGESLYDNGCVVPLVDTGDGLAPAGSQPTFNRNATYDAMRRWIRGMARIIPRWNLTGYAVENGKSILWFHRTSYGPPGLPDRDMFEGLGPARQPIPSGSIKWGRRYKVTSSSVTYGPENERVTYYSGQEFTGLRNVTDYQGDGTVMEADGIRATAEPRDWSNRWLCSVSLKPFHTSNSSIWKLDAFADINTPFWNRCHFYDPGIQFSNEVKTHIAYGEAPIIYPESPSAWNYIRLNDSSAADYANEWDGSGDPDKGERFYKSCRLYEPALEVESAVMDGAELKVTLTGRLHHHEDADASYSRDPSGWNPTDLANQDYRTHENGIMQYLAWQATGSVPAYKVGDDSVMSTLQSASDAPFGCVIPTLFFLKMIPEPYLDGNDTRQEHDSYRTHDQLKQVEVYLRAMCEGFVDGVTTAEAACNTGIVSAYDYSYENLMFQACSNRWVPLDTTVREDNPFTFGPTPNTRFYSQQFNALANAVNLLTDLRIMLPSELQSRSRSGSATSSISARDECGDPFPCTSASTPWFAQAQGSLSASPTVTGAWATFVDGTGANRGYNLSAALASGSRCVGDNWFLEADANVLDLRWNLTDPDAVNALPDGFAALYDSNSVAIMEASTVVDRAVIVNGWTPTALVEQSGLCGSNYVWHQIQNVETSTYCGAILATVDAPEPPVGAITSARWDTSGLPGTVGGTGGSSVTTVSVFTDGTGIIRIPTEAYAGGS